jgi:peptidoglycan/LPS O-acetylase OafA/YrhL
MSYSLYLWQQPFLNRSEQTAWTSFPLNLVLVLVCALASYSFVERPALAFRRRLERARKRGASIPAVVAELNVAGSLRA